MTDLLDPSQLRAGDTLTGHIRNAQQLLSTARQIPELLTPELLLAIAERLAHAAALAEPAVWRNADPSQLPFPLPMGATPRATGPSSAPGASNPFGQGSEPSAADRPSKTILSASRL
jgi:hypothetical protein